MTTASMIFRGDATSVERAASVSAASVSRVEQRAKGAGKEFQTASVHADKFGHSLKHIAALTIGTLGLHELVHGLREAVNAAGDVEKQQSKVVRVFGETPKVLQAFERSSAKAYGISHLAALKASASTGALLTNLGIGPKLAAGLSVGIQKLSADIGSFNDLPTAAVQQKVNTALLGQTRGLKSVGIALSDADVKAKAFSLGLVKPVKSADALRAASDRVIVSEAKWVTAVQKHGKESKEALSAESAMIAARKGQAKATDGVVPPLTAAQKALATYALILERSKVQQGDFARNQDKLSNSGKVLDAEFADLSDRVGNALEPSIKSLIDFMAGPGIAGANRFLTGFGKDAQGLLHAVEPLGPAGKVAAEGIGKIAGISGLVPGIVGATLAYQGYTRAVGAGQSIIGAAGGLIQSLVSPFRAVATEAATSRTVLSGAGFTGTLKTVTTEAGKGVNPLKAFATSTTGVGVAAGIAVGTLIALSSAEESVGDKARHAADDLRNLQDAQDGFKGAQIEATRTGLAQGDAARALVRANRDLASAQKAAQRDEPNTTAGRKAHAAAMTDLAVKTRAAAVAQNNYDAAHQQHVNAEQAVTKARENAATAAHDGVSKILDLAAANENLARIAVSRGEPAAKVAEAQEHAKAQAIARTTNAISDQIRKNQEIRPKSAGGFQAILDLIKQTGKIPERKTLTILLNDAASGKLAAVKREIDAITNKTVTLVVNETKHPFDPKNLVNPAAPPKAAGDIIDRPMLAMVGEEAPAHPEFIIPTNPARRGRALGLISQMRSWIPGFADGARPPGSPSLKAREAALLAHGSPLAPGKSAKTAKGKAAAKDNRPAWLKAFEDGGNKLPGDDAYTNAVARAQADLDDATGTPAKADDIAALHHLIKLGNRRLPALHALRNTHKEAVWQTAVNTQISSVTGQVGGYRSTLADLLHKPSPDEIQIAVPGNIQWAIERAGFTESPADDIAAQKAKAAWLRKQIAKSPPGAKRTALKRELARTNAELASLKSDQTQSAKDAADAAAQAAGTPPDVPLSIQEQLADAALTPDTADDLAALQAEQAFLQQAIAGETNPAARIALKESLAGVNDQIAGLTSTDSSSTSGSTGPTADDQAILSQTQARLALATRSAALSEAEVAAFGSSGDIGTGRSATAFDAARGAPQLYWGAPASTTQVASAAAQGFGNQPAVQSIRQRIAI